MTDVQTANQTDRPQLRILTPEKIEMIHEASMKILSRTGVSVRLPEAVELLAAAGCDVEADGLVKLPRRVVEECLDMTPDGFVIYDRNGEPAMDVSGTVIRHRAATGLGFRFLVREGVWRYATEHGLYAGAG